VIGPIRVISDPDKLSEAWRQQYSRLAKQFAAKLPKTTGLLVEIGCGEGQLTIPLAKELPRLQIIGVDQYTGPYSGDRKVFDSNLLGLPIGSRIKVAVSDYRSWLSSQPNAEFDAIISSEFLPEIDSKRTRRFFGECYRVLRQGGITVHSFLSAQPRNAKQRRLLEADSNPKWTKTPPLEWFSPSNRLVVDYLKLAGFRHIRKMTSRSGLVIRSEAARQLLKDWDVRRSYWLSHKKELEEEGLEIPDWIIVQGTKLRTDSPKS
jgi:cyclopropane fatty-acyl-phospholipid synthase-like methyltransferase